LIGKLFISSTGPSAPWNETEVSPEEIEFVTSMSALATRPLLPLFASSFRNAQPGSRFWALPPRCIAAMMVCRLVFNTGPGQQIWPFSFGSSRSSRLLISIGQVSSR
jgi:hypothetical protein